MSVLVSPPLMMPPTCADLRRLFDHHDAAAAAGRGHGGGDSSRQRESGEHEYNAGDAEREWLSKRHEQRVPKPLTATIGGNSNSGP